MRPSLFQYESKYNRRQSAAQSSSLGVGFIGASRIGTVVTGYNAQFQSFYSSLNANRTDLANKLSNHLSSNPTYTGMRNDGVSLAWDYEKADIEMGGKGSNNWNRAERQEIMDNGSVRGSEGHHQKNVADHPKDQANPDNIKFYRDRQEHLNEGHDGNWQNSTDAPMIDKNKMLQRTNTKRIIKKELQGVGLVAAVSFGIGASIEIIATLAIEGISAESVKASLINGAKAGLKSAAIGIGTYAITRIVSSVLQRVFHLGQAFAQGSAVVIVGIGFAIGEFVLLKKQGYSTKDAALSAGKNLLIGLGIFAISQIPVCGAYLAVAVSIIYISSTVAKDVCQQKFLKELDYNAVLWNAPVLRLEG